MFTAGPGCELQKDIANESRKLLTLAMKVRLTEGVAVRADRIVDGHAVPCKAWPRMRQRRIGLRKVLTSAVFIAGFLCSAQDGQPGGSAARQAGDSHASIGTSVDGQPQAGNSTTAVKEAAVPAANEHKSQISAESTHLLAMALALKAEVDKTNKDTLSLNVIRKADEIERLAKTVREKVK